YRGGARALLRDPTPPPADGKTLLPALLADLAERHERQIAALEVYTRATICRQRVIARHFGERLPVPRCGVCDNCTDASHPRRTRASQTKGGPERKPRIHNGQMLRDSILACLSGLPYPVGVTGLVRILRGSPDVGATATQAPQYGSLVSVSAAQLKREVEALLTEGLLVRDESGAFPVLRLPETQV